MRKTGFVQDVATIGKVKVWRHRLNSFISSISVATNAGWYRTSAFQLTVVITWELENFKKVKLRNSLQKSHAENEGSPSDGYRLIPMRKAGLRVGRARDVLESFKPKRESERTQKPKMN